VFCLVVFDLQVSGFWAQSGGYGGGRSCSRKWGPRGREWVVWEWATTVTASVSIAEKKKLLLVVLQLAAWIRTLEVALRASSWPGRRRSRRKREQRDDDTVYEEFEFGCTCHILPCCCRSSLCWWDPRPSVHPLVVVTIPTFPPTLRMVLDFRTSWLLLLLLQL
jgi:hypothetical protein